jgi:hypothetical protein
VQETFSLKHGVYLCMCTTEHCRWPEKIVFNVVTMQALRHVALICIERIQIVILDIWKIEENKLLLLRPLAFILRSRV